MVAIPFTNTPRSQLMVGHGVPLPVDFSYPFVHRLVVHCYIHLWLTLLEEDWKL